MSLNHTSRTTLITGLMVGPLALAITACGSSESDAGPGATDRSTSVAAPAEAASVPPSITPPTAPSTAGQSPAGTDAPNAVGGERVLIAAAQTSLGAVDGTIFSVYREAGGWDVHVVSADGTESEVGVSQNGTSVVFGPTIDPDDADDADDLAERRQLLRDAGVGYRAALKSALGAVPGGTVTGLELDLDSGSATWDVQLDEDTVDEQTVTIDAVSGDVLGVELDD